MADYQATQHKKVELTHLRRLFFARVFASLTLLFIFFWFENSSGQQTNLLIGQLFSLWFSLAFIQVVFLRFTKFIIGNLLLQLISDLIFIGFIIYGSGGLTSPFVFLLGLVIITAGAQARVLIVLLIAVLAPITYLIAIYTYAAVYHQAIQTEHTLSLLLQTSLFFLAGGIMALIARRHASLQQEQRKASTQHRQLQETHSQLLSSMQEGIITLKGDFTIQAFNTTASDFLGISRQHIDYRLDSFMKPPKPMLNFMHNNDDGVFRCEVYHHALYLLLTLTKIRDESAWLMTIVNITETRKLEQQLAEQDKLASIGQMAAMLAHEIRNPMQTISQAVELMGLNQQDRKLEHIVTDEISRLNRLVSDMLEYASPLHPHNQDTSIKPLIQASIAQSDLTHQLDIQVDAPDINIYIDPDHFRLVLDNLLRNAIRVSPGSSSVLITFLKGDKTWHLKVQDHGPGVEKEIQKTLFQPFHTGHKQGVGLGLATVWQVCQANGWHVSIDKTILDGACFVVQGKMNSMNTSYGVTHG